VEYFNKPGDCTVYLHIGRTVSRAFQWSDDIPYLPLIYGINNLSKHINNISINYIIYL
jgi:hypothetical protein